MKFCKKCNADFSNDFMYCPKCGSSLVNKFWDKEQEIGCFSVGNGQQIRVIRGTKNNIDYFSIGKQFYSNSDKNYKYKDAVAIPVNCVKQLISVLQKIN